MLIGVRVLALPDAWRRGGEERQYLENWTGERLTQNRKCGFTGRQSRGRQRKASLSALGYRLPPAKQKRPAGWLGPSLKEEPEQDHLPRAIPGSFTEFLLRLEKGRL